MAQDSSREASSHIGTQQHPIQATEKMELDNNNNNRSFQSATTPKKDTKGAIATGATAHSKLAGPLSDERRDERGYKATPGSSGPKTQSRAPPSPNGSGGDSESNTPLDRMDIFDWPGEDKNQAEQSSKAIPAQKSSSKRREQERTHPSDQVRFLFKLYIRNSSWVGFLTNYLSSNPFRDLDANALVLRDQVLSFSRTPLIH